MKHLITLFIILLMSACSMYNTTHNTVVYCNRVSCITDTININKLDSILSVHNIKPTKAEYATILFNMNNEYESTNNEFVYVKNNVTYTIKPYDEKNYFHTIY